MQITPFKSQVSSQLSEHTIVYFKSCIKLKEACQPSKSSQECLVDQILLFPLNIKVLTKARANTNISALLYKHATIKYFRVDLFASVFY